MNILITGGAGFLGINLIRFLLERNHNIVSLDIAEFNYPDAKDMVKIMQGDIRDTTTVERCMADVDIVVHAAAALPLYSGKEIYSTEVEGTRLLLQQAYTKNVKRFIYISSTAVYGIPDHHPISEDDKLDGVGAYGKSKIEAEKVCRDFRAKGMCVPVLRPKTFVGPERLGVFALLYDWASDGKNFPIIGKGNNRYQLLDVEDLCEAIHQCLILPDEIVNDTFNIGANKFGTLKNDYQAVLNFAGYNKKIISLPEKPAILLLKVLELLKLSPLYKWVYETASKDSFVSVEKAEKKMALKPKYSNEEALIRNFKWFLENRESFKHQSGVTHRVPWKQGILSVAKRFF